MLRRSFDNGKTWTDMEIIATEGLESVNQPCPVVDHTTGTIWMPFCKNNRRVFMMKSTDDGASWSTPVDITDDVVDPGWSYVGTGPGHGIQLKSGRLVVPSWNDVTPAPLPWASDLGPDSQEDLDLIFRLALPLIWSPHWIGQNVQSSYMIIATIMDPLGKEEKSQPRTPLRVRGRRDRRWFALYERAQPPQ